jgi:MarR family transcriptional regulator for hemolysin
MPLQGSIRGETGIAALLETQKDSIALRLTIVARLMRGVFDRKISRLNVTRSQWTLIVAVARNPGATQKVIADLLEMSEASAGRLVDRLCSDGLLERRPRADDRRAHAVYLSDAARPLMDELGAAGRMLEDEVFAGFSADDLNRLAELLDRMYENLNHS